MPPAREFAAPTRRTLIDRVRAGDARGWEEFCAFYSPFLRSFASRQGLAAAEVEDVVQEVFVAVNRNIRMYDRNKGRFHSWLFRLTRWRSQDALRDGLHRALAKRPLVEGSGSQRECESVVDPLTTEFEQIWDLEWQQWLLEKAFDRLKEHREVSARGLQAYDLCVRQELPVEKAAAFLKTTPNHVAVLKSRVLAALRAEVRNLERELA